MEFNLYRFHIKTLDTSGFFWCHETGTSDSGLCCASPWLMYLDVLLVLLDSCLSGTSGLSNVGPPTLPGDSVNTRYSDAEGIFDGPKETGDLLRWEPTILVLWYDINLLMRLKFETFKPPPYRLGLSSLPVPVYLQQTVPNTTTTPHLPLLRLFLSALY